jgi:hypothetical protein
VVVDLEQTVQQQSLDLPADPAAVLVSQHRPEEQEQRGKVLLVAIVHQVNLVQVVVVPAVLVIVEELGLQITEQTVESEQQVLYQGLVFIMQAAVPADQIQFYVPAVSVVVGTGQLRLQRQLDKKILVVVAAVALVLQAGLV